VAQKGYGSALMGGVAAAQGTYVLLADADGSYDFSAIPEFVAGLRADADMVIGTRFPSAGGSIDPGAMPFLHRHVGTPLFSRLGRLLFGTRMSDFNCGMRAMRRDAFNRLDFRACGMEFASEMIIKSTLFGLDIREVPIHFRKDRRGRPPHLRTFRDGWRHLRFMLIFSPRWLFIYPGLALGLAGVIGTAALLPGPVHLGAIGFDTNTLLVSVMLILLAHQLISMGVVAKTYAIQIGMHPPIGRGERMSRGFHLEAWAGGGLLLVLAGLALLAFGVLAWRQAGFGPISYPDSLRIVIPSVGLIMLGMQVIFASFLINIVSRSFG
jgi:glycosyltransferase involved in cell wall biosynthesis